MRIPTQDDVDQGFAIQMAEDAMRAQNPRPPEARDQDETPRVAPDLPKAYCPQCGKVFDYGTKGMSVLQMKKHQRRVHPEDVGVEM